MPRAGDAYLNGRQLPRSHDPLDRINFTPPQVDLDLDALLDMYRDWWIEVGLPILEELTGIPFTALEPLLGNFTTVEEFITNVLDPTGLFPSIPALVEAITGIVGGDLTDLFNYGVLGLPSQLNVGNIANLATNLLAGLGNWSTGLATGTWLFDPGAGFGGTDASTTTADGTLKQRLSNLIPVTPGQKITLTGRAKWDSLAGGQAKPKLFTLRGTGTRLLQTALFGNTLGNYDVMVGEGVDPAKWDWVEIPYIGDSVGLLNAVSLADGKANLMAAIDAHDGEFALAGFSQGAAICSEVYKEIRSGSMTDRDADFITGVMFGNPLREQGHTIPGGTDPGGHGVAGASRRLVGSEARWWEFAADDPIDYFTVCGDDVQGHDYAVLAEAIWEFLFLNWTGSGNLLLTLITEFPTADPVFLLEFATSMLGAVFEGMTGVFLISPELNNFGHFRYHFDYAGFPGTASAVDLAIAHLDSVAPDLPIQLGVTGYIPGGGIIEDTVAALSGLPATADWTTLSGIYTVPDGVKSIRSAIQVSPEATAGDVSFSVVSALKSFGLPQNLIQGSNFGEQLSDDLQRLFAASSQKVELADHKNLLDALFGDANLFDPTTALNLLGGNLTTLLGLLTGNSPLNAATLFGLMPLDVFGGVFPVSHLIDSVPEMIVDPLFQFAETVVGEDVWSRDTSNTYLGGNSITALANGSVIDLVSNKVRVVAGQVVAAGAAVKWSGLTGSGSPIQVILKTFLGDNPVADILVGSVPVSGSGGFTNLTSNYTVPAGVDRVALATVIQDTATAGQVWFAKPTLTLPFVQQRWQDTIGMSGLYNILHDALSGGTGALNKTLTDVRAAAATLLNALGGTAGATPANILTRLANISTGGLIDAAGLANITGTAPQNLITNLPTDLANRLLSSIFTQRAVAGSNLVISPDFEDTTIGRAEISLTYTTTQKRSGARSATLPAHTAGVSQEFGLLPHSSTVGNGYSNPGEWIRVQPGQKFYVEIWVYGKSTNTVAGQALSLFSCTLASNQSDRYAAPYPEQYPGTGGLSGAGLPVSTWTKMSTRITIPAGHDRFYPLAKVEASTPAGNIYYFDDAIVREETAAQDVISTITSALGTTDITGVDPLAALTSVLQAIPSIYMGGYGGPGTAADTWQSTWDQLISGAVGTLGTGSGLADIFNIFNTLSSNAAQGPMAFNLFGGLNNTRAMWRGRLPSSDATLPLANLMFNKNTSGVATIPTFPITQAAGAYTVWHIIQQDATKNVVQWRGHVTGSNTDFRARVLKMDATNGTVTPQQVSGNLLGALGTVAGDYATWTLGTPIAVAAGDIIGLEFQLIGSGTFNMVGDTTWDTTPHPTVFPQRMASIRSGSGTTTTLGSAYTHLSGFAYTDKIAATEFAISTGNPPAPHAPTTLSTTGTGAGTYPVPDWCNTVQLIVFPGGGKGASGSGTIGINGDGGNAGTPGSLILTRGTHFTSGDSISYNAGAGSTGSGGGSSSAGINANTVSRSGGTDGSGWVTGSAAYGASPGDITVDGITYNGGAQQTSLGAVGNVAGGGGAGGGLYGSGGNGAMGRVYIRLKQ